MQGIEQTARSAKNAARVIETLPGETKDAVLRSLADSIEQCAPDLLAANAEDMDAARAAGLQDSKLRRLELTGASLAQIAEGVRQIAVMQDPVNRVSKSWDVPVSGLHVERVRAPLGVIAMIYEARPGVTVDAFALCFKAGNACLLKGGREANRSNQALAGIARAALLEH
ncbi:MAG: gamma-glutamyl-phosphate reductase, partial [Phycisphaerales bacterium]|nr:gamma-glutamyl-phosphate reductase [Phycisphaerales bacterium]